MSRVDRRTSRVSDYVAVCARPEHLRRTGAITLVVGTWLTLFNHGPALLGGATLGLDLWLKVLLNFLTPFVVANLGLVSREL